ncbi:MAG: hypothetical protein GY873_29155 [Bosea sp.]|uniref:phage regulatory CII family protein n=1 Tax=Bosea sp. (in: a-proteobacteria) TaxID=1871050 RepID=UPI002389792A|nr:hypothetical protein [Bosea sp. (in: a-proteobacteria)]MCP4738265.1 hypothetical protein [Bosea sp. (in: a-proteobacteria)]
MTDCTFASLAHRLLIQEREADFSIESVAGRMGMSYDMLYSRLIQRTAFRPAEVTRLIATTRNMRLAQEILASTPFIAAKSPQAAPAEAELIDLTLDHVEHSIEVLGAVREAIADKRIDHRDRLRLLAKIREAESILATLRVHVDGA